MANVRSKSCRGSGELLLSCSPWFCGAHGFGCSCNPSKAGGCGQATKFPLALLTQATTIACSHCQRPFDLTIIKQMFGGKP